MIPWTDKLLVLWLDGRNYTATHAFAAEHEAASDVMALRVATLDTAGALSNERIDMHPLVVRLLVSFRSRADLSERYVASSRGAAC
jgi:hypothetical protein